ncbi:hypothetical protein A2U01_0052413 [Trifolium medium]|uniref:Uncharacterized protein n=1 Tax=Trifolium medium TaxID=97028 RepID=A0A392R3P3_9FABA|nr:hypothetical protein [Trifolium medium]
MCPGQLEVKLFSGTSRGLGKLSRQPLSWIGTVDVPKAAPL